MRRLFYKRSGRVLAERGAEIFLIRLIKIFPPASMRRYPVITFCDRSEYFVENCNTYFTAVRDGFYKGNNILYDDYEFIFDGDIYKINKKWICKRVVYAKSQVRKLGSDRAVISFEIVISFSQSGILRYTSSKKRSKSLRDFNGLSRRSFVVI